MFANLTGDDTTLNVRWLTATDPAFYAAINRPMADIVVRQLVLAKAIDGLELQLGHQTLFPFIIQPRVASGGTEVDVPLQWIWDLSASLPKKWENLRLAKIKRMSGENGITAGYSGVLRLIFSANIEDSSTEVYVFYADYIIDSDLTYQLSRIIIVTSTEESTVVPVGEQETIAGFVTFRTLDTSLTNIQTFLDLVAPPVDVTDANGDGLYDNPAIYELVDTVAGGPAVTDDFAGSATSHGTGMLTDSAWNAIPQLDSDIQSWVIAFNYPFDANANLTSVDGIVIPAGIFREMDIVAPAGDQPTGDTTGLYYPVYISRIERVDTSGTHLRFYFATYNVTDSETGGTPSTVAVEFATLDLLNTYTAGQIVEIAPLENLQLQVGTDAASFGQHFGRGHVVLSSLWGGTSTDISDFFDAFDVIVDSPADTVFSITSTRISAYGISRVPKYTPTIGQSRAMAGSTSRLTTPVHPSYDNRFICEQDQGTGNQVDLEAQAGITPNVNIDRYGFSGGLVHRVVKLVIDASGLGGDPSFYEDEVLPRLRILLGRDPAFGDFWYDGTRLKFFNGDTWQS